MSRYFMIQSWVGSHENEPDYNGQQCGERNVRSTEAVPLYDQYGNANVSAFSDEAIAARNGSKKATKVPLKQRILPQSARVEKLRSEILELETAYRAGEFSPEEYTLLREVQFKKLRRAEELLKKAITPVASPVKTEDETGEVGVETAYETDYLDHTDTPIAGKQSSSSWMVDFIDELSPTNSFKSFLKMSCKVVKTAVEYKHKAATYLNTLKEV